MNTRQIGREVAQNMSRDIVFSESSGGPVWSNDFRLQSLGGLTHTRSSVAGYYNSAGVWSTAASGVPRYEYDPVTLAARGILVEEGRTNSLLNSTTPANQTLTLATGSYSLSVAGTGSCVCAAGTAVGTGFGTATAGAPIVFALTTAGTVTFTVSGTLSRFQCERGNWPTAFIDTAGSTVTRTADVLTMNFSSYLNPAEGTFVMQAAVGHNLPTVIGLDDGSGSDATRMHVMIASTARSYFINVGGVTVVNDSDSGTLPIGSLVKVAVSYGPAGGKLALNGALAINNTTACGGLSLSTLRVGLRYQPTAGRNLNGAITSLAYYNKALSTAQLQQMTV